MAIERATVLAEMVMAKLDEAIGDLQDGLVVGLMTPLAYERT